MLVLKVQTDGADEMGFGNVHFGVSFAEADRIIARAAASFPQRVSCLRHPVIVGRRLSSEER